MLIVEGIQVARDRKYLLGKGLWPIRVQVGIAPELYFAQNSPHFDAGGHRYRFARLALG